MRDSGFTAIDYREVHCLVAEAILADGVKLTINEAMSDEYIEKVAQAVRVVAGRLAR